MNPILWVLLFLIAVSALAFALYKLGFRLDKLKVKLGLVEAEASRKPSPSEQQPPPATSTRITQKATEGATITKSGIEVPAGAKAEIQQEATGRESTIDDSPIQVK